MTAPLHIRTIVSMPFEENTYVVWQDGRTDTVVFDPGLEPDLILDFLRETGLTVAAVLNTHGHADHIGGNAALKDAFPGAPLVIGQLDQEMLTNANANLSAAFGLPITSPPADRTVREGETVDTAGMKFEVFEIPGHSPGHVVFLLRGASPDRVFGGDVLFRGGIGRSDFPRGDQELLVRGIPVVYPGHGPVTTVAHERRTNPFLTR
jgi:glyoxylase-like metal-dependent hydrolase (beta-lactamase superfamily II)